MQNHSLSPLPRRWLCSSSYIYTYRHTYTHIHKDHQNRLLFSFHVKKNKNANGYCKDKEIEKKQSAIKSIMQEFKIYIKWKQLIRAMDLLLI